MVEYKCKRCKTIFDRKSSYEDHLQRKYKCRNGKNLPKKKDHVCDICEKSYSRKDSLQRHLKICQNTITAQTTILKGNNNVGCGNQITHNGDINNNFTINIFPFGKDGVESLSTEEKLDILLSNQGLIIEIICKVNFDPNKPSHHNMYISDIKSPYGVVYNGEKWTTVRYPNIVHTLVEAKKVDLEKILDEMKEYLNDDIVDGIRKALSRFNLCDHKFFKQIMIHIKPILYDNRELIMNTRCKQKKSDTNDNVHKNDKYKKILKDGLTLSDIEKQISEKNKINKLCCVKREESYYFLKMLSDSDNIDSDTLNTIKTKIDTSTDLLFLRSMTSAIIKCLFINEPVDIDFIFKSIELDKEINNYLHR